MEGLRVLVVSPLAEFVAPHIEAMFERCQVETVTDPDQLTPAVAGRPRFDAALVDLTWNDPRHEWVFDGLDALRVLSEQGRQTAIVMAAQGHSFEADHLQEALDSRLHPEVVGALFKSDGPPAIRAAIEAAATGARLPWTELGRKPALHRYFSQGRGLTAARLAAAVASGRASRYQTLASVARVAPETATRLIGYLQPIIVERGEVPPDEPLTQASVYRWCGEHARYLLSWHRRSDPLTAITRWQHEFAF